MPVYPPLLVTVTWPAGVVVTVTSPINSDFLPDRHSTVQCRSGWLGVHWSALPSSLQCWSFLDPEQTNKEAAVRTGSLYLFLSYLCWECFTLQRWRPAINPHSQLPIFNTDQSIACNIHKLRPNSTSQLFSFTLQTEMAWPIINVLPRNRRCWTRLRFLWWWEFPDQNIGRR